MPSESTIELIKLNNTVGKKTNLPSNSPRSTVIAKLKNIIIGSEGIPLLSLLYGSAGTDQTLTLDAGEDTTFAVASDGTYLYAGTVTFPGIVVRVDLATFTRYDVLVLNTGEDQIRKLITDGIYLYVITYTRGFPFVAPKVIRINLQTFQRVDVLDLAPFVNGTTASATLDGTYLYVGTNDTPGRVVKIDTRTFTVTSTLTFNPGENTARALAIDGTSLYACTVDSPGVIVKINLATFTEVASITLDPGEDTETLFIYGEILYTSCYTIPVVLVKIDLQTFTRCHAVTMSAGTEDSQSIFVDGTYIYVASTSSPARVTIVDISRFEELTTITLGPGENVGGEIFVDQTYVYMTLRTTPGNIYRTFIFPTNTSSDRRLIHIDESCSNNSIYYLRPENSTGILLLSGPGAFVKGNYSLPPNDIIAANSETGVFFLHAITLDKTTINQNFEVDIAIGIPGSETIIATVSHEVNSSNNLREYLFIPNIKIAANTRVSARCSDETGANTIRAKLRIRRVLGG